eukprot:PhF_6_TR35016/c0_g1_i1/m.50957
MVSMLVRKEIKDGQLIHCSRIAWGLKEASGNVIIAGYSTLDVLLWNETTENHYDVVASKSFVQGHSITALNCVTPQDVFVGFLSGEIVILKLATLAVMHKITTTKASPIRGFATTYLRLGYVTAVVCGTGIEIRPIPCHGDDEDLTVAITLQLPCHLETGDDFYLNRFASFSPDGMYLAVPCCHHNDLECAYILKSSSCAASPTTTGAMFTPHCILSIHKDETLTETETSPAVMGAVWSPCTYYASNDDRITPTTQTWGPTTDYTLAIAVFTSDSVVMFTTA